MMDTKQLEQLMRNVEKKKNELKEIQRFFDHLLDPANEAGSVKIESWSVSKPNEMHTKSERFFVEAASPEFRQQVRDLLECFRATKERELKDEVAALTAFGQSALLAKN